MSFVNDVRTRAEEALDQGKQALGSAQKSAQARLSDAVGGHTVSFETLVSDLEDLVRRYRDSADKAVSDLKNDDRVEKLVVTAESLLNEIKRDSRVTQLVQGAETIYEALYETVQDRLVKPTKDLIAKTPVVKTPARKTSAAPAAPSAAAAPAKKAPAKKAPAKKAPAKKAPAKKAPAKKAAS